VQQVLQVRADLSALHRLLHRQRQKVPLLQVLLLPQEMQLLLPQTTVCRAC
jgi:hypothetical protein